MWGVAESVGVENAIGNICIFSIASWPFAERRTEGVRRREEECPTWSLPLACKCAKFLEGERSAKMGNKNSAAAPPSAYSAPASPVEPQNRATLSRWGEKKEQFACVERVG
jgi:hypothetical protein